MGPEAAALTSQRGLNALMKIVVTPILEQLSQDTDHIAQLGVLEDGMVTCLLESGGWIRQAFYTRRHVT